MSDGRTNPFEGGKVARPERRGAKDAACVRAPRTEEELDLRAAWLLSDVWPQRHGVLHNLLSRYGGSFDWEDIVSEILLRMLERAETRARPHRGQP